MGENRGNKVNTKAILCSVGAPPVVVSKRLPPVDLTQGHGDKRAKRIFFGCLVFLQAKTYSITSNTFEEAIIT